MSDIESDDNISEKSLSELPELEDLEIEDDVSNKIVKVFDGLYTSGMAPLKTIDPDDLTKFSIILSITEKPVPSLKEFANNNDNFQGTIP